MCLERQQIPILNSLWFYLTEARTHDLLQWCKDGMLHDWYGQTDWCGQTRRGTFSNKSSDFTCNISGEVGHVSSIIGLGLCLGLQGLVSSTIFQQ